jgi:hypothetical protein
MKEEPSSRFASASDGDIENILNAKDSLNTKKAASVAKNVFRAYLMEKDLNPEFEAYESAELDSILCKFYVEVRSKNGDRYKKASMVSIRHGLNRLLPFDIVNGDEFKKSSDVFSAVMVDLKRQGLGGIEHHPPLDSGDLRRLYEYFDVSIPEQVQEKVFVDILLYFGRRGRENLRELKVSDFACTQDSDGKLYVRLLKDELTKNHQDDTNTADGRMYQNLGRY